MTPTGTQVNTRSNTISFSRSTLLAAQLGVIMTRLTDCDEEYIKECKECLKEQKITTLIFCVMGENQCCGQLFFDVDWEKHRAEVAASGDMVEIKEKYKDVLPETSSVTEAMENILDEVGGNVEFYVRIPPEHHDEVCKRLSLHTAVLPQIEGDSEETEMIPRELKELKYVLKIGGRSNLKDNADKINKGE